MVDVLGLLICVILHTANIQERAGAKMLLAKAANKGLPCLKKVLADDGYSGQPMKEFVQKEHGWEFESVKRTELHQFKVMPQRWVVERTIGWMNNFRALSKDYDFDLRTGEANVMLGSIYYLSRRLTKPPSPPRHEVCQARDKRIAQIAKKQTQTT